MPQYDYVKHRFNPGEGETVEVPDEAEAVTMSTWGDPETDGTVYVRYLIPVGVE